MSPPAGWNWYTIDGAACRDGSPTGFYVRYGTSNRLLVYLEGGGACTSPGFCDHNPANLTQVFIAGGETVLGSTFFLSGLQQPGTAGIFDMKNAANPFQDWNQIYVPYCTGDVHFGTKRDGTVPGVSAPQQFVGYPNMQKFVARLVPTFRGVERVVLAGASAGGFGAGLNYGLVQDSFAPVPVYVLDDSGPPLSTQYLPACLQKIWRETWALDDALPADCTECRQPDGSGLMNIVDYWQRKYVLARVALVESAHDEVIRLFFSAGNDNCANNDPILLFLGTLTLRKQVPRRTPRFARALRLLASTRDLLRRHAFQRHAAPADLPRSVLSTDCQRKQRHRRAVGVGFSRRSHDAHRALIEEIRRASADL
jgi:hypothetical protein